MRMFKRIAVFAALVLGYVLTGMALSASQTDAGTPSQATAVAQDD